MESGAAVVAAGLGLEAIDPCAYCGWPDSHIEESERGWPHCWCCLACGARDVTSWKLGGDEASCLPRRWGPMYTSSYWGQQ